jgi:hypothetical protein
LKHLLRDVLDSHSTTIQKAKLQRNRHYDDELQRFDRPHPADAPKWAYIDQDDMFFDTDVEQSKSVEEHVSEENDGEDEEENGDEEEEEENEDEEEGEEEKEEEEEEEVDAGCSAANANKDDKNESDSDYLEMAE